MEGIDNVKKLHIMIDKETDMKPLIERSEKERAEVIRKVKDALSADVGELPACNFAGIDKEDYDLLVEKHPEIRKLAERAGDVLGVKASMNIRDAIEGKDVRVSQWYKEHTDPKYSKKMQVDGGAVLITSEDREKAINELFEDLKKSE